MIEDKRYYLSTLESRSYYGHPDDSTGVKEGEEEGEEAQIMTLSSKESDERGAKEASLVQVMGGQEDSVMEEETQELWGERDVLAERYIPPRKHR